MSRSQALLSIILIAVMVSAQSSRPRLGRVATAAEIQSRNISVFPSGAGLPPGHGTARQGRLIYAGRCGGCHGERGQGIGPNPALAGGLGTLTTDNPVTTVGSYWPYATTLWDYINRAMPPQNPGSLAPDELYSVSAYVLYLNGLIREAEVMDAKTLPRVKMPNRNGFVPDPRPDTKSSKSRSQVK